MQIKYLAEAGSTSECQQKVRRAGINIDTKVPRLTQSQVYVLLFYRLCSMIRA